MNALIDLTEKFFNITWNERFFVCSILKDIGNKMSLADSRILAKVLIANFFGYDKERANKVIECLDIQTELHYKNSK